MFLRYCVFVTALVACACSERVVEAPIIHPDCNEREWHCNLDKFQSLPIEGKLADASAILITRNVKRDDGSVLEQVDEVIKLRQGTVLYLVKGATYEVHKDSADHGEGSVVILRGSPAAFVESYSYGDGSIQSLGHMPMTTFKELAGRSDQ